MLLRRARVVLPAVARPSNRTGRLRPALFIGLTLATTLMALEASTRVSTAAPQSAQSAPPGRVVDPNDIKPWPDAATLAETRRVAEARPLFAASEPLVFSLVADFRAVQRDRNPESTTTYPATILVAQRDGAEVSIPLRLRTRGHSRLKPDFCTFAPLRLEFDSNPIGTVFEGQKTLKLGTHCRDQGEYPEYVTREYPVYRMFNLLTPRSFRARLAEARYVDAKSRKTIATRSALFLEDDDDVAKRQDGRVSDSTGVRFRQIDPPTTTLMTLFEYMIGNTDVSIRSLHNIRVVLTPRARFPVPYDFDFAGVVNAHYAGPNPLLQALIPSVRDRLYLGPCRTTDELEVAFARFRSVRSELMAVYDAVPALKPKYVVEAKKYLEGFYRTIERPESVKKAFIDGCETRPYY